ncbi:hypothetical protein BKA56DRAFT_501003, partial [Ilyonectria sp. MPI-CAGE-AT-0026]
DKSSEPYRSMLSSPKAQFFNTSSPGLNVGLVTEGKKSWYRVAKELNERSSPLLLQCDRLHAVFVRKEDAQPLQEALGSDRPTTVLDAAEQEKLNSQLDLRLRSSKGKEALLVISTRSLEGAIDALVSISTPIQQLAVLGPEAPKVHDFAKRWVSAKVISVGSICPVALPGKSIVARGEAIS